MLHQGRLQQTHALKHYLKNLILDRTTCGGTSSLECRKTFGHLEVVHFGLQLGQPLLFNLPGGAHKLLDTLFREDDQQWLRKRVVLGRCLCQLFLLGFLVFSFDSSHDFGLVNFTCRLLSD